MAYHSRVYVAIFVQLQETSKKFPLLGLEYFPEAISLAGFVYIKIEDAGWINLFKIS